VGFVVNEAALGKVFSEYFGILCHSFDPLPHTHHRPSSGAATISQIVADIPSGLILISVECILSLYYVV
jgi:hypothetical protein